MAEDLNTIPDTIGREKAQLDVDTLSTSDAMNPGKDDKVELDLDDAPFLMEEEEEVAEIASQPIPADTFSSNSTVDSGSNKAAKKKRMMLFGGLGLAALSLIAAGWWVLKPAKVPPRPVQRIVKKEHAKNVAQPAAMKQDSFEVTWEPFWVEQKNEKGEIRFLVCKFAVYTDNEKLSWEAQNKKVTLRDAIFYYLRNKTLKDLSDKENVQVLKSDLLQVVNQYMGNGQFKDVFIENYLVK